MKYRKFVSSDTNVSKFVFEWKHNKGQVDAVAEAVLYRYGSYKVRTVICCSVQSGCPVGCGFCGTGRFFQRNLTPKEIIEQIDITVSHIDCLPKEINKFQIMFMSMGEPFLNYDGLQKAIKTLSVKYPNAALLVSTSAPKVINSEVFEQFINLSIKIPKIGLQFSVHESTDKRRQMLIPTPTSSLEQIASLGKRWALEVGRKPFYNYCVHAGNSSPKDAERLLKLFDPSVWETTLSVICEKDESVSNSIDRQLELIDNFKHYLLNGGASLRVFNPAGQDDIGGGCGQLWYFQEWLNKHRKENTSNQIF